jgi:hypothetical protein
MMDEGAARTLVNKIQKMRKSAGLQVADRVVVHYAITHDDTETHLQTVIDSQAAFLATALEQQPLTSVCLRMLLWFFYVALKKIGLLQCRHCRRQHCCTRRSTSSRRPLWFCRSTPAQGNSYTLFCVFLKLKLEVEEHIKDLKIKKKDQAMPVYHTC